MLCKKGKLYWRYFSKPKQHIAERSSKHMWLVTKYKPLLKEKRIAYMKHGGGGGGGLQRQLIPSTETDTAMCPT
jgi:hypothetical protein